MRWADATIQFLLSSPDPSAGRAGHCLRHQELRAVDIRTRRCHGRRESFGLSIWSVVGLLSPSYRSSDRQIRVFAIGLPMEEVPSSELPIGRRGKGFVQVCAGPSLANKSRSVSVLFCLVIICRNQQCAVQCCLGLCLQFNMLLADSACFALTPRIGHIRLFQSPSCK